MLKSIVKSTIGSLVATAAFNMAYSINNIAILVCLNIVVFVGLYIASDKDDKLRNEYKVNLEEIKEVNISIKEESMKINEKLSIINASIVSINKSVNQTMEINENNGKTIESNINKLNEMLHKSLLSIDDNVQNGFDNVKDKIEKINENINNNININNKINNNLDKIYETIKINHEDMINACSNIEDEIKKSIINRTTNIQNATEEIINLIEKSTQEQNDRYEDIISENIEKIVDEIDSTKSQIASIGKDVKRNKNDIIEAIELNTDSNKEVISQYKEIQGAMLKELNLIADKNKHTTEVLMSNYKVLNAIMES